MTLVTILEAVLVIITYKCCSCFIINERSNGTLSTVFSGAWSVFCLAVPTRSMWAWTGRCSLYPFLRMLWLGREFHDMHGRSTHWTMGKWCVPLPSVIRQDMCTPGERYTAHHTPIPAHATCLSSFLIFKKIMAFQNHYVFIDIFKSCNL